MMEEEDNEELISCSGDESMSESEDSYMTVDKTEEIHYFPFTYTSHTTGEFLLIKIILIISSAVLLVLLPLYQESINVQGNIYALIVFNATTSALILIASVLVMRKFLWNETQRRLKCPLKWQELFLTSFLLTAGGFVVIYATDQKRVMCHLQDPMKGLILVFSLIYYFFFCKKLMGLQRIFSATTVIVGLFIAVDYALCNEFRCRGNERQNKSDDGGNWSWQTHISWSTVYIAGLAFIAAYFMIMERLIACANLIGATSLSTQLLTTVSRLVSFGGASNGLSPQTRPLSNAVKKEYSALLVSMWMQMVILLFSAGFVWIEFMPTVKNHKNIYDFSQKVLGGLSCLFSMPKLSVASVENCGNTSLYGWLFLLAYVAFLLSSLRFLILCQSAVHTLATSAVAFPLIGIWWSLFKTAGVKKGLLIWAPTISGELICALLGLPIVIIGLVLLSKSHFLDWHRSRSSTTRSLNGRNVHLA